MWVICHCLFDWEENLTCFPSAALVTFFCCRFLSYFHAKVAWFLYLLCGLGVGLCLGNPFLESGSGQAASCPAKQLRSTSGGLSGNRDGAREAVPALPGWWQRLCLLISRSPVSWAVLGWSRPPWEGMDGSHSACKATGATQEPVLPAAAALTCVALNVPGAARQMNLLCGIHLYF